MNCVSSDTYSEKHYIAHYFLSAPGQEVWQSLLEFLESRKDIIIIEKNNEYIHAESRSQIFRFVDDVEFHLRLNEGKIAIRSASRVGNFDVFANRKRLEHVRQYLIKRGLLVGVSQ